VIDLWVEGLDEPIGCTPNHPFWSEDRQDFVPAAELQLGERLRHRDGTSRVTAATPRAGKHRVYNLEVHGEHVYRVSGSGVLVHNTKPALPAGTVVYRVWGGRSGPYGRYWTTVNPATVSNYRGVAGLPNYNTGQYVTRGILTNPAGVTTSRATGIPAQGMMPARPGNLPQVVIPNPAQQVQVQTVSGGLIPAH
jgi:hypothetical protein